jgi:hypothetical protein
MKPVELSPPKNVEREKMARHIELLDIPSTSSSSTPNSPHKLPVKSTNNHNSHNNKKAAAADKSSSNSHNNNNNNIPTPLPRTPQQQQQPRQKTAKPPPVKSYSPPVNSNTPSESKYSTRMRVLHRLALQPWSLIELTKSLNRTNSSPREKLEQLDVKHILDTVSFHIICIDTFNNLFFNLGGYSY